MKYFLITMWLFTATWFSCNAQNTNVYKLWDNTIQGSSQDGSYLDLHKTSNGSFLLSCLTKSDSGYDKTMDLFSTSNSSYGEPWLMLLDENGSKLWDRDFYNTFLSKSITQLDSNVFVMASSLGFNINMPINGDVTAPFTPGSAGGGVWQVAFDTLGNILWNKRFHAGYDSINDETGDVFAGDIISLNGDIYIAATAAQHSINLSGGDLTAVNCTNIYNGDFLLFKSKVNSSATNEWQHAYGGEVYERPTSLIAINDGFLIGGSTNSPASCNLTVSTSVQPFYDFYLVHVDTVGNIIWQHKYGGWKNDVLQKIIDVGNNTYLLAGWTVSPTGFDITSVGYNDTSAWIVLIDSVGNKIWDKRFGSCIGFDIRGGWAGGPVEDSPKSVSLIKTSDGGYMLASCVKNDTPCGDVTEPGNGLEDYWVVKFDATFNKLWDKRFGGPGKDIAQKIIELRPGYYVIGGSSHGSNVTTQAAGGDKSEVTIGIADIWLVGFVDSSLISSINENEIYSSELNAFPNPCVSSFTINKELKKGNLFIHDLTGRLVLNQIVSNKQEINISNLNNGSYIISVISEDNKMYRTKIIKL